MKERYSVFINETIGLRKLMPRDIHVLLNEGFPYEWVLDQSLGNRLSKATGFIPNRTGFVAYDIRRKHALGFLSIVKHSASLYSIGYIYVAPNYRKMGLATGLLDYAVSYVGEQGGNKVYLTPPNEHSLLNFYLKQDFSLIVEGSMLWGGGSPEKLGTDRTDWSTLSEARPKEKKDQLFDLCKECMGKKWIDFFELNKNNLINGFSQTYKHFFSKNAFIFYSANSLALVFRRHFPSSSDGFVELYVPSDSIIPSVLNELSGFLSKKGIVYFKLTIFNVNSTECFDLLKEREFYPTQARILGRSL